MVGVFTEVPFTLVRTLPLIAVLQPFILAAGVPDLQSFTNILSSNNVNYSKYFNLLSLRLDSKVLVVWITNSDLAQIFSMKLTVMSHEEGFPIK